MSMRVKLLVGRNVELYLGIWKEFATVGMSESWSG